MAEDQEIKRSRVVVETPTARREVSRTEREYTPGGDGGTSTATIAVVVILAIGVVVLLLLLVMNRQSNDNANLAAQQAAQQQPAAQQPVIVQQPAPQQQPPIIVQQPGAAPASQPPIIVNPPATGSTASTVPDDASIQTEVEKRFHNDSAFSTLDITISVVNGKAMLVGTVNSEQLKKQAEKLALSVKGVKRVDNQIIVSG
ncbi:MAG TPA: BON domain-containing protein [Pyrinomonadaceae bacterium]|jgi:osmotically-inducible protein OsmY|nr:BON domain-containing protein [Pyrinomonadaceae bacterium]